MSAAVPIISCNITVPCRAGVNSVWKLMNDKKYYESICKAVIRSDHVVRFYFTKCQPVWPWLLINSWFIMLLPLLVLSLFLCLRLRQKQTAAYRVCVCVCAPAHSHAEYQYLCMIRMRRASRMSVYGFISVSVGGWDVKLYEMADVKKIMVLC